MADLRIALNEYRPRLIPYREGARSPLPGGRPSQPYESEEPTPKREAAANVWPRTPPGPSIQQQTVSPAFAARIYQANIPTHLYTYPIGTHPESASGTPGDEETVHTSHAPVTLVPYEPGTLVDFFV